MTGLDLRAFRALGPLAGQEQTALVVRAQRGDRLARDLVIRHNVRFVAARVRRYRLMLRGYEEDALAIGLDGLNRAIDRFDPARGRAFLTYASWWVDRQIQIGSRELGLVVRIPRQQSGSLFFAQLAGNHSLDAPISDDDERRRRLELLRDTRPTPEELFQAYEAHELVADLAQHLPLREREIVRSRHIDGDSVEEVSAEYGLPNADVLRLEVAAIQTLSEIAGKRLEKVEIRRALGLWSTRSQRPVPRRLARSWKRKCSRCGQLLNLQNTLDVCRRCMREERKTR